MKPVETARQRYRDRSKSAPRFSCREQYTDERCVGPISRCAFTQTSHSLSPHLVCEVLQISLCAASTHPACLHTIGKDHFDDEKANVDNMVRELGERSDANIS